MEESNIIYRYFDWICHIVHKEDDASKNLLWLIFKKDFRYTMPRDANRESDGLDLRYRFGYECNVPGPIVSTYLDTRPCSVLEAMVALCLRCEETCMANEEHGNRTWIWFEKMLESMSINVYTSPIEIDRRLDIMLDRHYDSNGRGGLFTIEYPPMDLRIVELWYQAMWWVDTQLGMR